MPTDEILSISAASADETIGTELPVTAFDRVGWSVVTSAGVSAGVVTIEWARASGYTGTWAELDAITAGAATTQYGSSTDHISGFVRARISTAITGGTVTVHLIRATTGNY